MDTQQSGYALRGREAVRIVDFLTRTRLLLAAVFLVLLAAQPLVDPDYFWHLKTGEYIVQNGLPEGDVFSRDFTGQKWILHEWLFEIILYSTYSMLGPLGVKLLTVSTAMAAIAVLANITRRITRDRTATLWAVALGFVVFTLGVAPRPQLVTFICFALFMHAVLRFKYESAIPAWWVLPGVMLVWVNSHAGYVIGIALLGLFLACEWLMFLLRRSRAEGEGQRLVRMTLIALATLAATLANPWFIEHWIYPFEVLGMSAIHVIAEWQSPDFHKLGPKLFLAATGIYVFSLLYARRKPDLTELLVPAFFIWNGFVGIRHVPLAILAIIPFLGLALSRGVFDLVGEKMRRSTLAGAAGRFLASPANAGRDNPIFNWLVLIGLAASLILFAPKFESVNSRKVERAMPVHAADFILANGLKGNMFNEYGHGGYLIYRLFPQVKVIIDGRADLYGDKFIDDFLAMNSGKSGWKEKFESAAIDFAVVTRGSPIHELLVRVSGFQVAHADDQYVVLVKNPSKSGLANKVAAATP
jgi:hypothetical protein